MVIASLEWKREARRGRNFWIRQRSVGNNEAGMQLIIVYVHQYKLIKKTVQQSYTAKDLEEFQQLLMKSCDLDGDGKICREELTMMLLGIQKFKK